MEIKNLTILGKSDAVITMILDNLESNHYYPNIEIVNNLKLPNVYPYLNPKFIINLLENDSSGNEYFLGVNKSVNKLSVFNHFKKPIESFINIIHSSSQISSTTTLGYGCLINSLVSVAAHTKICNFVSINRNSSIGHHTIIEDFVTINPGVNVAGFVTIGEKSLIGMGTNIIDGIKIGKNTIIGAGSLVTKDIPDNVIAYGSPCKIVRKNE